MNEFGSPFRLSSAKNNPFSQYTMPTRSRASVGAVDINKTSTLSSKGYNPFLESSESARFRGSYGKNEPLKEPMLVGHWNGKPVMGGSRLFLMY